MPIIPIQLTAKGGTAPYTFSATINPFHGLSLSSSGLITGTPSSVFTGVWVVTVTDSLSNTANLNIPITILPKVSSDPLFSPVYESIFDLIDDSNSPEFEPSFLWIIDDSGSLSDEPSDLNIIDDSISTVEITDSGGGY